MDRWAAISHTRAALAQSEGRFLEVVPIQAWQKDKDGNRRQVTVSKDDGIRGNSTPEALAKIRAAFPQWPPSQTTGGNASQITDGGAAVLLMTRKKANELGLNILAKYVTTAVIGLAPRIMGIGPSLAIPKALQQAGITMQDVDLVEVCPGT